MNSSKALHPGSPPSRESTWVTRPLILQSVREETANTRTFTFAEGDPAWQTATPGLPGQFNMLYAPGYGEAAISLCGLPDQPGTCLHTIRLAGDVTQALFRMQPGDTVGCRGPFGRGWPLEECENHDVILVGGGIGLAPMRSLVDWLMRQPRSGRDHLLLGARSPELLLYREEFDSWRQKGLQVLETVDRGSSDWSGNIGAVPLLLDRLENEALQQALVLICGPEIMMRYTAQAALDRGIPPERIWLSMERHMNCAVGLCGRCQWGSHLVCTRGPVLRYDEIQHQLHISSL